MRKYIPKKDYSVSMDMLPILLHYLEHQDDIQAEFTQTLAETVQGMQAVDERIPVEEFIVYWDKAVQASQDDHFGLHFGIATSLMRSSGILYPVMMNCPTLESALEKLARYHNLVTDFIQLHLERQDEYTVLYLQTEDQNTPLDRPLVESIFCSLVHSLGELARDPLHALEIRFSHEAPEELHEYQRIFNCPLQFGQDRSEMHFDTAALAQPVMLAKPALLEQLERVAQQMQAAQVSDKSWVESVTAEINYDLTYGEKPTLNAVANRMAISPRQLQNKLQDEGSTYQEILEQVREDQAIHYLQNAQTSVCEIAFMLGFSEQSTFNHAFKRWTGLTPGAYRENYKTNK